MEIFLPVLILISVVSAVFFWMVNMHGRPDPKRRYLPRLEQFVGGRLEEVTADDTAVARIVFQYKDLECVFEELTQEGFADRVIRNGYLRAAASGKGLSLRFTEKTRDSLRSSAQTFSELTGGSRTGAAFPSPKALSEFNLHTNHPYVTQLLLEDDRVARVFSCYKNLDYRGHPVMSLELNNGQLELHFHTKDNLIPSLFDLEHNVTTIEEHLDRFYLVVSKIGEIEAKDEL